VVDLGGDFMGKGPSRSRLAKLLLAEFFTVQVETTLEFTNFFENFKFMSPVVVVQKRWEALMNIQFLVFPKKS
jgi:hypothetical protein